MSFFQMRLRPQLRLRHPELPRPAGEDRVKGRHLYDGQEAEVAEAENGSACGE